MIGKTLGHYQITSQLGKGGMGEVFRARDQKLGRDVAIKVLPEEFARDADRVARFQREAKLLASLNHPNIAAIHGLEESEGTNFLVLELVDGETLADRIKAGPIRVEESLRLALQIAEALEAAHEKGVIHRDLKPTNIKVTPENKVKVLDFGLAKAFAGEQAELNLSNSPTLSDAATQQGVILGTAAYMPPEQAKGKAVDKRADIWAFGVVLFEMLVGRQLFSGETVSETLASVIKSEPEWKKLPANLHPRIRLLLERCMKKDPRDRYSSISDCRVDIQDALADPSGVFAQPVATAEPPRKLRTMLPWIAAAIVLGAILAGVAVWKFKQPESPRVMRFEYELPQDQQLDGSGHPFLAVSRDGSKFAYNTNGGIYLRSMDQPTARLILGSDRSPRQPFFSPDGQWIGYWSQVENQLKKISINGGAPVSLTSTANPMLASWGDDDMITYTPTGTGRIMRISANGGDPELLCETQGKIIFAPQMLPDGKSVLFTQMDGAGYKVMVQSLKSSQPKALMTIEGTVSRYLPTGHIIYMVGDSLNAVPFNLKKLELAGGPVSMLQGILWVGSTAAPQYAISDSGTLVCVLGTVTLAPAGQTLVWVDRKGKEEPLGAQPGQYLFPRISPDGTRVALTIWGENPDIWIWDLARKTMTRLTFDKSNDIQSIWTPDSKCVLFWSGREGKNGAIFRKPADGTGEEEKLVADPDRQLFPWALTSDGKSLVVVDTPDPYTKGDLSMLAMEGDHARKPLLQNPDYVKTQAKLSPDGRWMAYTSNESGIPEIYVRSFPEMNKGRWQVSTKGGVSPLWAPNGRELFYFGEDDSSVMAVSVETGQIFSMGTPRKLFSRRPYLGGGNTPGTSWDIHPDGNRFLMVKLPETAPTAPREMNKISIVINWTEELKQRVPVK